MKVLHTGDLHFSNKADKLLESVTTTDAILVHAAADPPDIAVIAGDTVDEHDSPIRIDSDAARAAISFVTRLADICPVVIVRGTRSHDRESPYLFAHLKSEFPIHVATQIEMVDLFFDGHGWKFRGHNPYGDDWGVTAVFSCIPSPDKSNIISAFGGDSKQSTTLVAKEALHDVLTYIGEVNAQVSVPRILVAHGMITGSEYSSGTIATGEDFEFSLSDLAMTNTDLKCFNHVHKQQSFPGNVHYSGSPGRMNFGEKEEKGFLVHEFNHARKVTTTFYKTPARYFVFGEYHWVGGLHGREDVTGKDGYMLALAEVEQECQQHPGCDARFRMFIPEEERHVPLSRQALEDKLLKAGARAAKIEINIIPQNRTRAAGISRKETLAEKVVMWGTTTQTEIPARTLEIAGIVEGMDAEELIEVAKRAAGEVEVGTVLVTYTLTPPSNGASRPAMPTRKEVTGFALRSEEEAAGEV